MFLIFLRSLVFNVLFYAVLVCLAIVALPTFALPPRAMLTVAEWWAKATLFLMRVVDYYWQVAPEFHETLSVSLIDVALPIALGGIFITLYAMRLKSQSLLPLQDAGLEKALTHHVH